MKVLLINKFLYPKGGDAIVTLSTGQLLREHGHEVFFWGMKSQKAPSYPHNNLFTDEIDLNSRYGIKQQLKLATTILYSFEAKRKVERLIRTIGKPDVVHLHNFSHQISPSILHVFRKYKIPCVMTMHDYKLVCPIYVLFLDGKVCEKCRSGRYFNCLFNKCSKYSYTKSLLNVAEMYLHHDFLHIYDLIDIFISPSQFLKTKCEEMGFNKNIVYLPNFVKTNEFVPNYEWNENYIVYVGRLSSEKGLYTLIEAMAQNPNVTLKIIGEGPIRDGLKQRVKELSLSNIQFLGYKSGEELKKEVQNSMFGILPSEWYENNPRSIIEGFALGKPAIGSDIGGIPELIINGETGYTFRAGDSDDLGLKISKLSKDVQGIKSMAANCRRVVEQKFGSETHYRQLMNIYGQVL